MKIRNALLAATIVSAPGIAAAQMPLPSFEPAPPLYGLYIGGGGGFNWLQNEHLINGAGTAADASLQSKFGYAAIGTLGWAFTNGLRAELEGDFRNNQFSAGRNFGFPAGAGGRELKYGPMVNVLYDMTNALHDYTGLAVPYFAPYVGVGVGYQWSHLSGFTASPQSAGFPGSPPMTPTEQLLISSFSVARCQSPRYSGLAMTADYRFFGVGSRKYDATAQANATSPATFGSAKLGNDFNHAIVIGLRYNFGQPTPAPLPAPLPVAAPAPAPARSYLVFFDWDKSRAHRACTPDHQGRRRQFDPRAVYPHRGQRLHRYLRHAQVQSRAVGPSGPSCRRRADQGRRATKFDRDSGFRRHPSAGVDRSGRA